jgi:hypothetical protein
MPPNPEEQIQFLVILQRLLDEALSRRHTVRLLLALADLSIKRGDDSGAP